MFYKSLLSPPDVADIRGSEEPPRRRQSRRRWRQGAAMMLVVAGLVALGISWVGGRGLQAREHLQRAASLVAQLRQEIERGNATAAAQVLAALQRETRAARAGTGDPGWGLGSRAPVVGDNLSAVRTVAVALDDLAHDGLPPLVQTAGRLNLKTLAPTNGRFDLGPLQAAGPALAVADAAVRRAYDRVAAIAADELVVPVRNAVVKLRRDLQRAAATTATAARTAAVLPPVLGTTVPRTYLVLFQNLAEVRATGGMPGAYVVVAAARGSIQIVDQGSATRLQSLDKPPLPLDPAHRALYSDRMGMFTADINLSPDFPTAARLAREMYRVRSGRTVDGVLATDPVALSYLLGALGPVSVPGGPALTEENAVRVLLSETYGGSKSPQEQDRYFAAAALATFQAIMGRPLDPARLSAQLARASGERRILFWSAVPAEQRALTGTVLAGTMPASDGARPTVGVFLNDGSGAKLGYYLRPSAQLAVVDGCRSDGRREVALRVTLGSVAPRSGLSKDVLGLALAGDPYTVRTVVAVYSPTAGAVVNMRLDGAAQPFGSGADGQRAVGIVAIDLKPGATRTLDVRLLTGVATDGWGATVMPQLWTTPTVAPWPQLVRSADGCPNRR